MPEKLTAGNVLPHGPENGHCPLSLTKIQNGGEVRKNSLITGVVVVAVATTLFPASVLADFYISGSKLADDCKDEKNYVPFSFCQGYITGVADTFDGVIFCTPGNAKVGQLRKVVTKYLDEHPEELHRGAAALVTKALREVFPCKLK